MNNLGYTLRSNKLAQVGELAVVFAVPGAAPLLALPLAGENPLARQAVVWVANVVMLALVWAGLRMRGQGWAHLGLARQGGGARALWRGFLKTLAVFLAAVVAFVVGSIVMANIVGKPEGADMSGYDYLRGNLPLLLAALPAVWFVSSLGEEIVYRGFLITRLAEMGAGTRAAWRWAVGVSALAFGAAHFQWGLIGVVQTACMGLALGISYRVLKRNLWILVVAHAYMDTILFVQMYLPARP